ncbi:MAG: glycine zipper 2TM domain-containing protein [Vicinamibacterales bacterium]
MSRLHKAVSALLVAGMVGIPYTPALAGEQRRDRRDRYERRDDRRDDRRANRAYDRGYERGYWDASRYYRQDNRRYQPRRLGRNDRIYRGSDNRYYCQRDDGTTGLIIGGMAGGVLGNIIAPGGSKTLGAIIGAGAGALIGRQVDRGDIVCR